MDKTDAETELIISEQEKNIAEKIKFDLEAQEIRQRLKSRWFKNRIAIEAIVGGIVASALVAVWLINYFQPIFDAETELKEIEIRKLQIESSEFQNQLNKIKANLNTSQVEHTRQLERFRQDNAKLNEDLKNQGEIIESLKKEREDFFKILDESSVTEQKTLDALKTETQKSINLLSEKEALIKQAAKNAEDRDAGIERQINAAKNSSFIVGIYSLNKPNLHNLTVEYFKQTGYTIDSDWKLTRKPSWLSLEPAVFYYSEKSKGRAMSLAKALNDITNLKLTAKRGAGLGVSKGLEDKTFYIHLM